MRTRVVETSTPGSGTWSDTPYIGTCTSPNATGTPYTGQSQWTAYSCKKVMTDVETEGFHKIKRRGGIVNSPMQMTVWETFMPAGSHDGNWKLLGSRCSNGNYPVTGSHWVGTVSPDSVIKGFSAPIPTIDVDRLRSIATAQAYSNIGVDSVLGYATIGESKETLQTLISLYRRVLKVKRAARRLDVKALKGLVTPKALQDAYMEYRYALRPMYYEANGIIDASFKASASSKPLRQTFRGKAFDTAECESDGIGYSDYRVQANIHSKTTRTVEVRVGVLTSIGHLNDFQYFGLDKPFEGLWELVPLSFVIDWFVNVGDTIGSWTPKFGFTELASWTVVKDAVSTVSTVVGTTLKPGAYQAHSTASWEGTCTWNTYSVVREPIAVRSILPSLNIKLDPLKLLDLGIIVKQLRSR